MTHASLGLWLSMIKSYRLIQSDLAAKLQSEFNLSLPQFQLLAQIAGHENGRRMSDLADALLMSNGNITGLANRLALKGWVQIQKSASDKRVSYVKLSETGQAAFAEILKSYESWVNAHFDTLSETESHNMRQYLRMIRPE